MKMEIKNKYTGTLIFATEALSLGEAVLAALKAKADLSSADLSSADLSSANLSFANLRSANLSFANLRSADLSFADLSFANLRSANLSSADLSFANLRSANLRFANLRSANLRSANLSSANLSQSKGIPLPSAFLSQFKADAQGVQVYRAQDGDRPKPSSWKFEPGAFLTETPNPDRGTLCGCGVHFATLDWVRNNHRGQTVWLCRIRWEDVADVIVPFGTDGKARCARLELIKIVK